jgi:peptidoglycan-associated lipoprotein
MRSWKSRKLFLLLTLLVACVSFSCRRNPTPVATVAPPPPPPPPPPPAAAPTITLTATPATITAGQQSTLQWEATNATAVVIEPEVGNVAAKGNQAISPQSSVTYTARATGPGGNAQAVQRITVNAVPPPAPTGGVGPRPAPTVTLADMFQKEVASQPILFDYDSSEIRADQVSKAQSIAQWLKRNSSVRVSIQGHADERGSQEYNVALGDERAASVMNYLVAQGVSASQLTTVSYGEERPVCRTPDEQCFQQNRRANLEMAN